MSVISKEFRDKFFHTLSQEVKGKYFSGFEFFKQGNIEINIRERDRYLYKGMKIEINIYSIYDLIKSWWQSKIFHLVKWKFDFYGVETDFPDSILSIHITCEIKSDKIFSEMRINFLYGEHAYFNFKNKRLYSESEKRKLQAEKDILYEGLVSENTVENLDDELMMISGILKEFEAKILDEMKKAEEADKKIEEEEKRQTKQFLEKSQIFKEALKKILIDDSENGR